MRKTSFKTSQPVLRSPEGCLRRSPKKLPGAIPAAAWAGVLCLLLGGTVSSARAGASSFPNLISGTIEWNNSPSGTVYPYLTTYATYHLGMNYEFIFADQVVSSVTAFHSTTIGQIPSPAPNTISTHYEISVEAGDPLNPPIPSYEYDVYPFIQTPFGDTYYFATAHSVIVPPAPAFVSVSFSECTGLIDLGSCDASGNPVTPSYMGLYAYLIPHGSEPQAYGTHVSGSHKLLPVRGAPGNTFDVTAAIGMIYGTDAFLDRFDLAYNGYYNAVAVDCDQIVPLKFVVPPPPNGTGGSGVGTIIGIVEMLGENEHWLYHDFTVMRADDGPSHHFRYADVGLFTQPGYSPPCPHASPFVGTATCNSAGQFSLVNMLPSNFGGGQKGYRFQGELIFGLGRGFERFQTPYLHEGENGTGRFGTLLPNTTVDLGNTFVLDPGNVVGTIRMCGPEKGANANSLLRYILRASDSDFNGDQIPDSTHYENETSHVKAVGCPSSARAETMPARTKRPMVAWRRPNLPGTT